MPGENHSSNALFLSPVIRYAIESIHEGVKGKQKVSADTSADTLSSAEENLLATVAVPVERHEVVVNGVRLHYLTCGPTDLSPRPPSQDGKGVTDAPESEDTPSATIAETLTHEADTTPLLLLHGRGNASALFAPILAQLASQRRVFALDLPGWGLSDKPPFHGHSATDALAIWREGALGFLDALGLAQADVLGHSMGGFTALSLALEHPPRVKRLILVDSGGLGREAHFDVRLYFWLKPERIHRWLGRGLMRYALRQDNPKLTGMSDPYFEMMYALTTQPEVIPSGAAAFNRWVDLFGVHLHLLDRLKHLDTPTLLLWGERDRVTPYADALVAVRHMPRARLVAFTGCGHQPFVERADDFARVVLVWLNGGGAPSRV